MLPPIDEQRLIVARVEAQLSVFAALKCRSGASAEPLTPLAAQSSQGALGGEMIPHHPGTSRIGAVRAHPREPRGAARASPLMLR